MSPSTSISTFETLEEYAERTQSLLAEDGLGEWLLVHSPSASRVSRIGSC